MSNIFSRILAAIFGRSGLGVDINARIEEMAAKHPHASNWRDSIVDLMKICGLDSGPANRKRLAAELGRPDYKGTAADNVWLHKTLMQKLRANGGRVPSGWQ